MADLSKRKESVGFIGAGNMAGALIRGLVRAGFPGAQVRAFDKDAEKTKVFVNELGIQAGSSVADVIAASNVVVLGLKPALICAVAGEHAALARGRLWVSVAAGITSAQIESALGGDVRVVRAMPNTPALIGEGATGLCGGRHATEEDLALAHALLDAAGMTVRVTENMMDAVTAVSGSGPAFVMLVIEAMTDGGVRAGLPRPLAQALATQTVRGAAAMLQQTGKHPGELKDMVTSPGGTTIAGVEALEARGLRGALIAGVVAAADRSRELGKE